MDWKKENVVLTDDTAKVDLQKTYLLLSDTYWAAARPLHIVEKMIKESMCFSLHTDSTQVGFVRIITDFSVISWVADFVLSVECRGRKLGAWMMQCVMEHPELNGTQFVLQTKDAHGLYEKLGFSKSESLMSTPVSYLHGSRIEN